MIGGIVSVPTITLIKCKTCTKQISSHLSHGFCLKCFMDDKRKNSK